MREDTLDAHAAAAGVSSEEYLRTTQERASAMPNGLWALREQVLAMPINPDDRHAAFRTALEAALAGNRVRAGIGGARGAEGRDFISAA